MSLALGTAEMCCAAAPGVSSHTAVPFPGALCKASVGLSFCDVIRQGFPEHGSLVGHYAVVLSRWLLMF